MAGYEKGAGLFVIEDHKTSTDPAELANIYEGYLNSEYEIATTKEEIPLIVEALRCLAKERQKPTNKDIVKDIRDFANKEGKYKEPEGFHVTVARVETVTEHPDKDLSHLSLVKVLGKTCIAGKKDDGSYRYEPDDLVIFLPINSVIPVDYLKFQGYYWDEEKDRGMLKGSKRNRVGAVTRGSVTSEGLLLPVDYDPENSIDYIKLTNNSCQVVSDGNYIENLLGITEFKG